VSVLGWRVVHISVVVDLDFVSKFTFCHLGLFVVSTVLATKSRLRLFVDFGASVDM